MAYAFATPQARRVPLARPAGKEEMTMLDMTTIRAELKACYDLEPSLELAQQMSDIHARMDRVMPLVDWAIHAPYVAAINALASRRE